MGQRNSLVGSSGGLSSLTGILMYDMAHCITFRSFSHSAHNEKLCRACCYHFAANVPGFGRLIDGIQRKKSRETMVIAVVVGILLCITIW